MKTGFFILLLFFGVSANSQTLKELLYSGKLKSDTGTVVHKTDDLSTKIDTTRRPVPPPPPAPEKTTALPAIKDSLLAGAATRKDSIAIVSSITTKDNNKIWKDYIDTLVSTLRTDVLPSKKIKEGTYSVLIDYTIDVDGQILVNNISCVPESSYLTDQIRQRMTLSAPQLSPLIGANGKPRKAPKKQTITLSKT